MYMPERLAYPSQISKVRKSRLHQIDDRTICGLRGRIAESPPFFGGSIAVVLLADFASASIQHGNIQHHRTVSLHQSPLMARLLPPSKMIPRRIPNSQRMEILRTPGRHTTTKRKTNRGFRETPKTRRNGMESFQEDGIGTYFIFPSLARQTPRQHPLFK